MTATIYGLGSPNPEQQHGRIDSVAQRQRIINAAAASVLRVQQQERSSPYVTLFGERPPLEIAPAAPVDSGAANVHSLDEYRSRANSEAQPSAVSLANMAQEFRETG